MDSKAQDREAREADADLVGRAMSGDRSAFTVLVEKNQNAVFGLLCSQLRDRSALEDLAQEVFVEAYQQLASIQDPTRFRAWLGGIARNVARRWLRTARSEARMIESFTRDMEQTAEAGLPSPLDELEQRDVAHAVWCAVDGLPPSSREAVLLHYVGGLNDREIAQVIGISASAATRNPTSLRSRDSIRPYCQGVSHVRRRYRCDRRASRPHRGRTGEPRRGAGWRWSYYPPGDG